MNFYSQKDRGCIVGYEKPVASRGRLFNSIRRGLFDCENKSRRVIKRFANRNARATDCLPELN